jgi:acetyl-CoA synthetase
VATEQKAGGSLEQELERLLDQETFEPSEEFREQALLTDPKIYDEAEKDLEAWWAKQAEDLHWFEKWDTVLDDSDPPFYKWFVGGKINVSYNCLDRHIEAGQGDRVAYHWRGEEGEELEVSYADLHRDVQRFANALKDHGIEKGDVVGIFLPMIPEVVVAMLACARIGAIHNVVFGGFSAESVKERMEFSEAKALVTVDGARRKGKTAAIKDAVDEVMGEVKSIETIFVVKRTDTDCQMQDGRDVWYHEALEAADPECEAEPLDAEHPLYILYTSGSTAKPKGIQHRTGGYLTGVAYTHKYVFDLKPDKDVYWCAADVGWVTGHSYIVYGPLANGATSVMYEGAPDYPDKDVWWDIIERYGVTILYTAPTAIRACMKWGVKYPEKHDLSSLRLLGSVGEPINPKAWLWYWKVIGGERCPVVDTWWQTETGAIMITPLPGITAAKPGSATIPLPGIQAAVWDEEGEERGADEQGLLVLKRPWPSMLQTLYREDDRFIETYFEKYGRETYLVGDAARRDEDDYFWVVGRVDDVINVSGHRMSTAEIESAVVSHSKVAECAVIGQQDEDTGQSVAAFVTLEGDLEGSDDLVQEIREHVAKRIGKLARPKRVIWAGDLPKTRSGKIMRRLLRDIAEGRELGDVTTLRDPDVMSQLEEKVKERQAASEE